MFSVNDYVLYGSTGICRITDKRCERFGGTVEKEYYILQPAYSNNCTIYVPTGSEAAAKMQPVLSAGEVFDLIRAMPEEETVWIKDENLRKENYMEILKTGNREKLIQLVKTLYLHKQDRIEKGRKFYAADETILAAAEKLLYGEFALVLHIQPEDVVPFIKNQLQLHTDIKLT